MNYTSTIDPGEHPGLTLDTLLNTLKDLEAMLPEMLYRTSEYCPLTNAEGEPMLLVIPELDPNSTVMRTTGREIVILHPDNLPHLQGLAKGNHRLVEWIPNAHQT